MPNNLWLQKFVRVSSSICTELIKVIYRHKSHHRLQLKSGYPYLLISSHGNNYYNYYYSSVPYFNTCTTYCTAVQFSSQQDMRE